MNQFFSSDDLKLVLPYRSPMLFIDSAKILSETEVIGLKLLTMNEAFFQGHFPAHPIMPGVLQVEAMFQTSLLLCINQLDPSRSKDVYLHKLKKVKFRKPVHPGDRLFIESNLISMDEKSASFKVITKTSMGLTSQAELTISVRPRKKSTLIADMNEFDKCENGVYLDTTQIMNIIPHRYPFLFVDYISKIEGSRIFAVKNLTTNEFLFDGYQVDYPVLSSAIQCEIVAQSGCVFMLSKEHNKGKLAYFMGINTFEAFSEAFPGDQLVIEMDVPESSSRFGQGVGVIRVEDRLIAKIELTFAIMA